MKMYYEKALRQHADKPMLILLDMWHGLCREKIGTEIEVMVGSRKEHPRFADFRGELHTAIPEIIERRLVLLLLMDSMPVVNGIIASHELGHWILKLQDFKMLKYQGHENSSTEIFLDSMIQHVPLYHLQRSVGHNPQNEVDSRCLHNLKLFSREKEANTQQSWADNALMLVDDLLNCSPSNRTLVMNVISNRHPNTSRLVKSIMQQANSRDLLVPEQNLAFAREVVRCLGLPGEWYLADDVGGLIAMHRGILGNTDTGGEAGSHLELGIIESSSRLDRRA